MKNSNKACSGIGKTDSQKNRILIVGNGFDLDCGFDTSYKTFGELHFLCDKPIEICRKSPMYEYLRKSFVKQKEWFCLEDEIRSYVLDNRFCLEPKTGDKEYFDYLVYYLKIYLPTMGWITPLKETSGYVNNNGNIDSELSENPSQLFIKTNSVAYELLRRVVKNPSFFNCIVSFNYTNLGNLLHRVIALEYSNIEPELTRQIERSTEIKYVHINDNNNRVVLGIEEGIKYNGAYQFVQKSRQMSETMRQNTINTIYNADELVVFGHSLGSADADYFKPLFNDMFAEKPSHERKITIITYYDNEQILKQIEYYAGHKISSHHSLKNIASISTYAEESKMACCELLNDISKLKT